MQSNKITLQLIIFGFLISTIMSSCSFFYLYNKKDYIKNVKRNAPADSISTFTLIDSNNVVTSIYENKANKLTINAYFNSKGKRVNYVSTASCDSCFLKYLKSELSIKGYKWKKINDTTYVSSKKLNCTMHIMPSIFSYQIKKND